MKLEEILKERKLQLKTARRKSHYRACNFRHNWGDFHTSEHIKKLQTDIHRIIAELKLQASNKPTKHDLERIAKAQARRERRNSKRK